MSKKLQGNLMLLLTALIWGAAFVAQRAGMEYIEPFTFNCLRSLLGGIALIPVIFLLKKLNGGTDSTDMQQEKTEEEKRSSRKVLIAGGVCCGVVLFVSSTLQQMGLVYTTAGKGGFITALYIVIVPILGKLIGHKIRPVIWLCVLMSLIGLYLLCMSGKLSLNKGDLLILLCAFGFAVHILVIDYFSPKTDGVKMSCIQFFVCGILSVPFVLGFETIDWGRILDCWLPICYAGILSSGAAYTLQIVAQKNTEPAVASMLLSLESVFAMLTGIIILHERVAPREMLGCLIMFAAIVIAQMPSREERLAAKTDAAKPGSDISSN